MIMISLKELIKSDKDIKKIDLSEDNDKKFAEKYKNIKLFEGLKDDDICMVVMVLYLIWMQENENERLWNNFKKEIMYKSHFFPKSELLQKVDDISEYASAEICKGTVLYRAREYTDFNFFDNKEVITLYEKLNEFFPSLKLQLEDVRSESAINIVSFALGGDDKKVEELFRVIKKVIDEERPFWGFDEKNCDAPPKEYAKAGRANSMGISFLYVATDKKTAIMEMRPQIGQLFNVCEIELCRDIRIFDFTYSAVELKENEYTKSGDLYVISKEFSRPNYGNVNDYIPTQYLCEYISQKGFDGIRYKSAVSPDGINMIIFDTNGKNKAYKIIESRVYGVTDMDIKFEQMLPFEIDSTD